MIIVCCSTCNPLTTGKNKFHAKKIRVVSSQKKNEGSVLKLTPPHPLLPSLPPSPVPQSPPQRCTHASHEPRAQRRKGQSHARVRKHADGRNRGHDARTVGGNLPRRQLRQLRFGGDRERERGTRTASVRHSQLGRRVSTGVVLLIALFRSFSLFFFFSDDEDVNRRSRFNQPSINRSDF